MAPKVNTLGWVALAVAEVLVPRWHDALGLDEARMYATTVFSHR